MTTIEKPDPAGTDLIAAALASAQAEMPSVPKGKTATIPGRNGGSGYSYSYADLADVTEAILPLLTANGLAFTCAGRAAERGYELVGRLLHVSGQSIEGALPLHGNDPQSIGSAITYARRYLLGCLTGVVTDDDTDAGPAKGATRARAWDGPTTAALLNAIDADAQRAGVTYEQAVTRFMQQHNLRDVAELDALDPWVVQPFAESVRAHADKVVADREAAAASGQSDQPTAAESPTTASTREDA